MGIRIGSLSEARAFRRAPTQSMTTATTSTASGDAGRNGHGAAVLVVGAKRRITNHVVGTRGQLRVDEACAARDDGARATKAAILGVQEPKALPERVAQEVNDSNGDDRPMTDAGRSRLPRLAGREFSTKQEPRRRVRF